MPLPSYALAHHPLCLQPGCRCARGGGGFLLLLSYLATTPTSDGGRTSDWRAAAPTLFVFVLATVCTIFLQDLTSVLPPTQHPCMPQHFTPTSLPPTPLHLIAFSVLYSHLPQTYTFQHTIFCKYIGPGLCVRFFVKGAHSMGLLHKPLH